MARALVKFMSNAKAVRAAVLSEFDFAPSVKVICAMRGAWLKRLALSRRNPSLHASHELAWDWTEKGYHSAMAGASRRLLKSMWEQHPGIMLVHEQHGRMVVRP